MPVVGVSVVCAVPNGTFIALAPRSLHLAEFRHPQFIAPLRLTFFWERGERAARADTYRTFITRYVYLQNFFLTQGLQRNCGEPDIRGYHIKYHVNGRSEACLLFPTLNFFYVNSPRCLGTKIFHL